MYMYMYNVLIKIRAIWLAEISRDGNPRLQKIKSRPGAELSGMANNNFKPAVATIGLNRSRVRPAHMLALYIDQRQRAQTVVTYYTIVLLFSVDVSLRHWPASRRRARTDRTLYSDDLDLDRLKVHMTMLPDVVRTYNDRQPENMQLKPITKVCLIAEILQQNISTKSLLSELHKLLRLYFTIPMSNANSERSFSSLRRLKTYLRSTMSQKKLNHVAFLHVHKHLTRALDLKSICKTFSSTNDRRRAFFGTWKWCSFKFCSIQNYLGKFEGTSLACAKNAMKTLILTISLPDLWGTGPDHSHNKSLHPFWKCSRWF